jgi:hypothetical protein
MKSKTKPKPIAFYINNRIRVCCVRTCISSICQCGAMYSYFVADSIWNGVNGSVKNSVGDWDFVGQTIKEMNRER